MGNFVNCKDNGEDTNFQVINEGKIIKNSLKTNSSQCSSCTCFSSEKYNISFEDLDLYKISVDYIQFVNNNLKSDSLHSVYLIDSNLISEFIHIIEKNLNIKNYNEQLFEDLNKFNKVKQPNISTIKFYSSYEECLKLLKENKNFYFNIVNKDFCDNIKINNPIGKEVSFFSKDKCKGQIIFQDGKKLNLINQGLDFSFILPKKEIKNKINEKKLKSDIIKVEIINENKRELINNQKEKNITPKSNEFENTYNNSSFSEDLIIVDSKIEEISDQRIINEDNKMEILILFYSQLRDIKNNYHNNNKKNNFSDYYLVNPDFINLIKKQPLYYKIEKTLEKKYSQYNLNDFRLNMENIKKEFITDSLKTELFSFRNKKNISLFPSMRTVDGIEFPCNFNLIISDIFFPLLNCLNIKIKNYKTLIEKYKVSLLINSHYIYFVKNNYSKKLFICDFNIKNNYDTINVNYILFYINKTLLKNKLYSCILKNGLINYFKNIGINTSLDSNKKIFENEKIEIGYFINLSKKQNNNYLSKILISNKDNEIIDNYSNSNEEVTIEDKELKKIKIHKTIYSEYSTTNNQKEEVNNKEIEKIIENNEYYSGKTLLQEKENTSNKKLFLTNKTITSKFISSYKIPTLIGLKNINQKKFMNSIIQCLSNIESLTSYFLSNKPFFESIPEDNPCYKLSKAYFNILNNLWQRNILINNYYEPKEFDVIVKKIEKKLNLKIIESKDFLNFIYDNLNKELNFGIKYFPTEMITEIEKKNNGLNIFKSNNCPIIKEIFYGEKETSVKCITCGKSKYTYTFYNMLIFPLKEVKQFITKEKDKNRNDKNKVDLIDCFEFYKNNIDPLDNKKIFCSSCKSVSDTEKITKLKTFPEILTILIDREKNDNYTDELSYPLTLSLDNYLENENDNCQFNYEYDLIGVLLKIYKKNKECYFIAYCKSPIDKSWYCYNDIFANLIENPIKNKKGIAEALFYQKLISTN